MAWSQRGSATASVLELPVTFRPMARDDLANIFDRVLAVSQNVATAERFVRRIRNRCARIGRLPFGGRARDDLAPGLRLTNFERSVVIAYRVEPDRVDITNLFGRGRDYEGFYAADEERRP